MTSALASLISQLGEAPDPTQPGSTTFADLPSDQRPTGPTACSHCPSAVWYALPTESHCDCLLLRAESYTSDHPSAHIVRCDGILVSTLSLLKKQAR